MSCGRSIEAPPAADGLTEAMACFIMTLANTCFHDDTCFR